MFLKMVNERRVGKKNNVMKEIWKLRNKWERGKEYELVILVDALYLVDILFFSLLFLLFLLKLSCFKLGRSEATKYKSDMNLKKKIVRTVFEKSRKNHRIRSSKISINIVQNFKDGNYCCTKNSSKIWIFCDKLFSISRTNTRMYKTYRFFPSHFLTQRTPKRKYS